MPGELRARHRWVRWQARTVRGRTTKTPLTTAGTPASVSAPTTWSSWDQATASPVGDGVGYVLVDGDGIVCIDLDHCLSGGVLAGWAAEVIDHLGTTYVEVSPSGDGLHVWGLAESRPGRRYRDGAGRYVELYARGRYVTVTGRRWMGSPSRLAPIDVSGLVPE